eukprot:1196262-Prorocentrum_minimum.AAC.3
MFQNESSTRYHNSWAGNHRKTPRIKIGAPVFWQRKLRRVFFGKRLQTDGTPERLPIRAPTESPPSTFQAPSKPPSWPPLAPLFSPSDPSYRNLQHVGELRGAGLPRPAARGGRDGAAEVLDGLVLALRHDGRGGWLGGGGAALRLRRRRLFQLQLTVLLWGERGRTNQTQEAWVYSHNSPTRRRKRGCILTRRARPRRRGRRGAAKVRVGERPFGYANTRTRCGRVAR